MAPLNGSMGGLQVSKRGGDGEQLIGLSTRFDVLAVTVVYFSNIFHVFRTFSTLVISTFYAFSTMFSTFFIMIMSTHMANFLI